MKRWMGLAVVLCAAGLFWSSRSTTEASASLLRQLSDETADVVEKILPSVVVVQTEATRFPIYRDIFFRTIPGRPEKLAGQGSGVIIDKEGYILTSQHVIQNADTIKVVLYDGTTLDAELVGEDKHTDLGVLKIIDPDGHTLVPIEPGDSDALRVGEFVIAIGSPFSLSGSVTMGWVSQKGRAVGLLPYEDFIQTDAAINPGNSGGPLVNAEGRMVGLNAVIQTAGPKGSIGIGFSVPANRAFTIARTLIAGESVTRPWLGILPQEMNIQAARNFLNQNGGVYVGEVFRDTPAYKAGLYRGDIILKVDGEQVTSILELQREVFRHEIGTPIPLTILRSNSTREIEIVSERMPDAKLFQ
jgi:serine protease Do